MLGGDDAHPPTVTDLAVARQYVNRAAADVLVLDDVADDRGFEALGGDSVLAVVLIGRIWEETGIRMPVTALTSQTTLRQLALALLEAGRALRDS